ncbi:hypothetical protein MRX96_034666 [Rhipicephalus microplus]
MMNAAQVPDVCVCVFTRQSRSRIRRREMKSGVRARIPPCLGTVHQKRSCPEASVMYAPSGRPRYYATREDAFQKAPRLRIA